ncbi:MAG: hypothetical protein RI935_193 [Candidatus Parcubacteria bacterium]|jgi:hypothetical protein
METSYTKKQTGVVFVMILILVLLLLNSFLWDNKKVDTVITKNPIILRDSSEFLYLLKDADNNKNEDWKDSIASQVSTSSLLSLSKEERDRIEASLKDPNNTTASLSKNIALLSAYLSSKPNISEEEKRLMLKNLLDKEEGKFSPKVYSINDFAVIKNPTEDDRKVYGNALGVILEQAIANNLHVDDIKVIERWQKTKKDSELTVFGEKEKIARKLLNDLVRIKVPEDALIHHTSLVNTTSTYVASLYALSILNKDSLPSVFLFDEYVVSVKNISTSFLMLRSYFEVEGVIFTKKEKGVLLFE